MPIIAFHSVKGGAGCTTVATLFALQVHRADTPVHLSTAGNRQQLADVAAILGLPGIDDYAMQLIRPGFTMGLARSIGTGPYVGDLADIVQVVDAGTRYSWDHNPTGADVVLVMRNDYLSLRRAVEAQERTRPSGIVLLEDPSWPLGEADVADVVGLPVLETFQTDAAFQRHMDAGIIAARRHPHYFPHLAGLIGLRGPAVPKGSDAGT